MDVYMDNEQMKQKDKRQTLQVFHPDNTTAHYRPSRYQYLNILLDKEQIHHLPHFSRAADKFHKPNSLQSLQQGTILQYLRNNPCLKSTKSASTFPNVRNRQKSWFLPGVPCSVYSLCILGFHPVLVVSTQRFVGPGRNMAAKTRSGGTQRVLQKLNKSIEDGEYYEAHQLIRTLYFR